MNSLSRVERHLSYRNGDIAFISHELARKYVVSRLTSYKVHTGHRLLDGILYSHDNLLVHTRGDSSRKRSHWCIREIRSRHHRLGQDPTKFLHKPSSCQKAAYLSLYFDLFRQCNVEFSPVQLCNLSQSSSKLVMLVYCRPIV